MKLSVIVPVYNMASEGKLEYCLNSLVNQTLTDLEIIAVDDCSTDESMKILEQFARQYPDRVIAIHSEQNHHQGGAKNIGLTIARGEWLGFIDADDWITPDYYEKLLQRADETGADMVGCDYNLTYEHSMKVGQIVHNNNDKQTGVMDHDRYKELILETGSLVVKVYRRELILEDYSPKVQDIEYVTGDDSHIESTGRRTVSDEAADNKADVKIKDLKIPNVIDWKDDRFRLQVFPEDIFYEDNAVSNTWMVRSQHFEYIPEPWYYYYQHDSSTVHTVTKKNLEDRMTAGRQILREAQENGYFDEYRDEIEYQYIVLFYVNTLFSAMPKRMHIADCYAFTRKLAKEMRETFPDFQNNHYYTERTHAEEKKLIQIQMKSHLLFYVYYRLLWFYRDLRSKKN